jgi:serine/threonine protein kinase
MHGTLLVATIARPKKRSNNLAAGLAYLHGESVVHSDVKARNVLIGADDRAKLGDFGCANKSSAGTGGKMIGGTPAFMAPEVARGEEQGPAADVWALGCTVVEMATGRAPWTGMDGDALAAMHRIAYTDAVPEVPHWLSAEAKDFLGMCLVRWSSERCTAAQLLEHPFLASTRCKEKLEEVKRKWVSPKRQEHAGHGILGVGVRQRRGRRRAWE